MQLGPIQATTKKLTDFYSNDVDANFGNELLQFQVHWMFVKAVIGDVGKTRAIQCDDCDHWFHVKCINMAEPEFLHLTNTKTSWICTSCICPLTSPSSPNLNSESEDPQVNQEPNICLKRGFKIAYLNINRLIHKQVDEMKLVLEHSFYRCSDFNRNLTDT